MKTKICTSVVDPGYLSRIPESIFFHPGSRVKMIPDYPPIRMCIKEKIVSKLSEI
jgi:hypothetical protein